MERYRYRAINETGRSIKGEVAAASEADLYNQLQNSGLELITCSVVKHRKGAIFSLSAARIKIRDLIQLFLHMNQMQEAGVPMLDALADVRDTTENQVLRDIMAEIHRDVSEGSSLSEAMNKHPRVFTNLYVSLIKSGEETGDLPSIYKQLIKFLKWLDDMRRKVKKAMMYPMIVTVVVIITIVVMMGFVVPQITGFLENMEQALPFATTSLIATSEFFAEYWWAILLAPVLLLGFVLALRRTSEGFCYQTDKMILKLPVIGNLVRKISIARYAQTFSALFASGIDVISALKAARKTVSNRALIEALETVEATVQEGQSLSESLNSCGEFPSLVVRMVKVGEESGKLSPVLDQVSDFYTRDVEEAVDGMITLVEPTLTGVLGGMILWIAVGVFGPIYSLLENLDF